MDRRKRTGVALAAGLLFRLRAMGALSQVKVLNMPR